MSRQFRICMAKGGSESARPSYGRPKLTLISRKKNHLGRCPIFAGNSCSTGISQLRAENTVKTAPQPLFVNRAFVALYVSIISPVGPIPISLFLQFNFATIVHNSTPAFQNCQFKSNKQQWEKSSDDYLSCF